MEFSARQLRRAATQWAIEQVLRATANLPTNRQSELAALLVGLGSSIPTLRSRVRENMQLALGPEIPGRAEEIYFRRLVWFLSNALPTYHRGIAATPVLQQVKFDDSIRVFDAAVAEGKGVVVATFHWVGHELAAGLVSRRHPTALLVRRSAGDERTRRKLKWYEALGVEIVLRPERGSAIKDAAACLRVLKAGNILAITPDLLANPAEGVATEIFGRSAWLPGGAFALASLTQAPLLTSFPRWQTDGSVVVAWDRVPTPANKADRNAVVAAAVAQWCTWFEDKLKENPENWLFWLDRRWSRFLRGTPRKPGIQCTS